MKNTLNRLFASSAFAILTSNAVSQELIAPRPTPAAPLQSEEALSERELVRLRTLARIVTAKIVRDAKDIVEEAEVAATAMQNGYESKETKELCLMANSPTGKKAPASLRDEFAESLETQVILGGINKEDKERQIVEFEPTVTDFEKNLQAIREVCKKTGRQFEI